jgi:hypothetical protein
MLSACVFERPQGKKAFKERFFVLWRHPDLISGDYTLFWFESETDQIPKGHQTLPVGKFAVNMPKNRRKGYDFCFRIDMTATEQEEGRKFILAAQSSDPEGEVKMKLWKDSFAKIEADAPTEKAAEAAKAADAASKFRGAAGAVLTGVKVRTFDRPSDSSNALILKIHSMVVVRSQLQGAATDATADREKALRDKVTEDIVGAGILSVVTATPVRFVAFRWVSLRYVTLHCALFFHASIRSELADVCLPVPDSVRYDLAQAASLLPTAMRTGWLRKEGKGNKAFKRRFFVLWSTEHALLLAGEALEGKPNATPGDNVLVYYESPGEIICQARALQTVTYNLDWTMCLEPERTRTCL